MARKPAPGTRDRILDTAARLFYDNGVHAVGQQQLIEECGCGKNLLYREFASKDDLVVAYLERKVRESEAMIEAAIAPYAGDPAAQMVAIVRTVAAQVGAPGYRGCPFLNVHAEFPDPDHPANRASVAHRHKNLERFRDLAEQAGASNPDVLADRILLIVDGMHANGAMQGGEATIAAAVAFVEEVVHAATAKTA
jgi:AcrR family transcriptional regulator